MPDGLVAGVVRLEQRMELEVVVEAGGGLMMEFLVFLHHGQPPTGRPEEKGAVDVAVLGCLPVPQPPATGMRRQEQPEKSRDEERWRHLCQLVEIYLV